MSSGKKVGESANDSLEGADDEENEDNLDYEEDDEENED